MRKFFFITVLLLLSGCATVPNLPDSNRIRVSDIIQNVQCELAKALDRTSGNHVWLQESAVAVELTLRVEERGDLGADAAFVFPVQPGILTIGLSAGVNEKASVKSVILFTANYSKSDEGNCTYISGEKSDATFTGSLGLHEWISRVADGIKLANVTVGALSLSNEKATVISHQLDFSIVASGGVGPKYNIVRSGGRSQTESGRLGLSREETNTLRVAIIPKEPKLPMKKVGSGLGDTPRTFMIDPTQSRRVLKPLRQTRELDERTKLRLLDAINSLKLDTR